MRTRCQIVALRCGLAVAGIFSPGLARAGQIVLTVDEQGRKVYINVGDQHAGPRARRTSGFRPLPSDKKAQPDENIKSLVEQTASRFELDPDLIHAIIKVESQYNPNAVSHKGAMGLMQLVPATARRYGVENPFDPKQNIEGGVNYLKYLLGLFRGDLTMSLAAYNAGENSVLKSGGIPAFTETQDYVRKVTGLLQKPAVKPPEEPREKPQPAIYRYLDSNGVVHFTNGE